MLRIAVNIHSIESSPGQPQSDKRTRKTNPKCGTRTDDDGIALMPRPTKPYVEVWRTSKFRLHPCTCREAIVSVSPWEVQGLHGFEVSLGPLHAHFWPHSNLSLSRAS